MKLFDLHCDTLYECYTKGEALDRNNLHIDIERMSRFDTCIQTFAVWMPDHLRGEAAWKQCSDILGMAHSVSLARGTAFPVINTADDLRNAVSQGKTGLILAVEGGSALAGSIENVGQLAEMSVKMVTLTWNGSNELGHGCMSGCDDGLTSFGKQAVREMCRKGIIPDVSHLNNRGFWDVMDCADGPVAATHSVSYSVHGHPRNLDDCQFSALCDAGGIIGLNLCGEHLGEQTFDCFKRHLDHYLELGGEKHIALGCDFDGTDIPHEWGGIQVIPLLYQYLREKGYDETLLDQLFFSNSYEYFLHNLTNTPRIKYN